MKLGKGTGKRDQAINWWVSCYSLELREPNHPLAPGLIEGHLSFSFSQFSSSQRWISMTFSSSRLPLLLSLHALAGPWGAHSLEVHDRAGEQYPEFSPEVQISVRMKEKWWLTSAGQTFPPCGCSVKATSLARKNTLGLLTSSSVGSYVHTEETTGIYPPQRYKK